MREPSPMRFHESENCFRLYEEYILAAVHAYPQPISIAPIDGHSPYTDEARVRNALTSWCRNGWESEISGVTHSRIMRSLTSWLIGENIFVGPKFVKRAIDMRLYPKPPKRRGMKQMMLDPRLLEQVPYVEGSAIEPQQEAPPPDYSSLTIEELVVGIDENSVPSPQFVANENDNLTRVRNAIGERMNVAYVIDKETNQIRIF